MTNQASQKFIHKVIHSGKPEIIKHIYRMQRSRECQSITLKVHAKKRKSKTNLLNNGHIIYNSIDKNMRCLNPLKFKYEVKKKNKNKFKQRLEFQGT